jgi:ABC-2 type transport system ATP-binding protein
MGGRSSLRFNGPVGLNLSELSALLPRGVEATEPSPGAYLLEGPIAPEVVATVTNWCASRGVVPDDLSLGRRSLEEVFLELVSRDSAP